MGVRLLEGRTFTAAEYKSGTSGALVSAGWARKYFPGTSAIGRKMVSGGCTTCPLTEVVGIVSDVKYQGLDGDADAVYTLDNPARALSYRMVARTSGSEDAAIRDLRETVRKLDSEALVDSTTMRSRVGRTLNEPRYWAALVGGFAAVAVGLAALGVFGLMSYMVRQQRREIGVRLALGATPVAITQTVVKRGMGYAVAGSIAGALLAVLAGHWLQASTFGIQTTDSIVVVAVGLSLALLAAVASWWPGRQAARVRPIEAMTVE
jgi:putative ABC transport system permease protein